MSASGPHTPSIGEGVDQKYATHDALCHDHDPKQLHVHHVAVVMSAVGVPHAQYGHKGIVRYVHRCGGVAQIQSTLLHITFLHCHDAGSNAYVGSSHTAQFDGLYVAIDTYPLSA